MNQQIINLLKYPRTLQREILSMESCPHDLLYNKGEKICQECYDSIECEWLYRNDAVEELTKKTHKQLIHDLEFAILIVQAHITRMEHDSMYCECEACTWLQSAQILHEELLQPPFHLKNLKFSPQKETTYKT